MILKGLYQQLIGASSVASALATPAASSVFMNVLPKTPPRPSLVLNRVGTPPAGETLDGISDLIDGEIQFDSYADDPNAAVKLSHAVRDYLVKSFNAGELPDGTTIQFVAVTMDHDEPYEMGGVGYLFRALLRLQAFYTEAP